MTTTNTNFAAALASWRLRVQDLFDAARTGDSIELMHGPRYVRVVRVDSQRVAAAFICIDTGDVLKADSWGRPSRSGRRLRGNIFTGPDGVTPPNCLVRRWGPVKARQAQKAVAS